MQFNITQGLVGTRPPVVKPDPKVLQFLGEDGMRKLKKYLEWESTKWENIVYSFNLKKWKSASLVLDIFDDISSWNIIESDWFQVNNPVTMSSKIQEAWKIATIITPSDIFSQAENNPTTLFVVFGSLYMLREFLNQKKNSKLKNES